MARRLESRHRFALAAGGCLLGWVPVSCAPTPEGGAHAKAFELELLSTEKCPLVTKPGAPERAALGFKVRVTGRAPEGIAANYFYASVVASDGSRYLAELPGCEPVLTGAPLAPGEAREGYLNIPFPAHKNPRTLVYLPPVGNYPVAQRALELTLKPASEESHD
jgi:hypothetical protein